MTEIIEYYFKNILYLFDSLLQNYDNFLNVFRYTIDKRNKFYFILQVYFIHR